MVRKIAILEERPTSSDSMWLSVSKAKTFKDCKAKFKFGYIQKLPRKTWSFHTFGKFAHEALERFHQKILEGSIEPYHFLMTVSFKETSDIYGDQIPVEDRKEIWNILNEYLKQLVEKKNDGTMSEVIEVEKQFYIDIDGKVLLNGFIDRVQIDPDGVMHVTDYKTSKSKKYLQNDFMQLQTYAYVMCAHDPSIQKVRTSYMMLRHNNDLIVKEFSRKEIMTIEDTFIKHAETIDEEKLWAPSVSKLCGYCDFISACPEGKKFIQIDKKLKFGTTDW